MGRHRAGVMGLVYLLHFDRPYEHARHYLGWTEGLVPRLHHHLVGSGSRLMAAVTAADVGWRVVATARGTRRLERALKNQKKTTRLCPVCRADEGRRWREITSRLAKEV